METAHWGIRPTTGHYDCTNDDDLFRHVTNLHKNNQFLYCIVPDAYYLYRHKLNIIAFNFNMAWKLERNKKVLHYLVCVRWAFRSAASLVEDVDTGVTVGGVRAPTAPQTLRVTAIDASVDRIACS